MKTTLRQAADQLKPYGMRIRSLPATREYRVNFAGGREATAYYATEIDDAVNTGKRMAESVRGEKQ